MTQWAAQSPGLRVLFLSLNTAWGEQGKEGGNGVPFTAEVRSLVEASMWPLQPYPT